MTQEEFDQLPAEMSPKRLAEVAGLSVNQIRYLFDKGELVGRTVGSYRKVSKFALIKNFGFLFDKEER